MTDTLVRTTTRTCTKCKVEKPRNEEFFPRNKRMADGMSSWCFECHAQSARDRVAKDPEANRARARQWTRDNPERNKTKVAAWVVANPERKAAGDAAWRLRNPERVKLNAASWQTRNRERHLLIRRAKEARRRAHKANAAGSATVKQVAARIAYYGGLCWMCKAPWEHIDHVIPLARGGSNWPSNLRPACQRCNCSKGAKRP